MFHDGGCFRLGQCLEESCLDLWEFIQNSEDGNRQAFYCLQPLVIKAHEGGRYEVVDGQQRLTTIYILLTYLKDMTSMLGKTRFEITFETRSEANEPFLSEIDLSRSEENVDFFHICEAYNAIDEWFSKRDTMHRLKLLQHFLNDDEAGRNVKVIWFQLSDRENPVEAFTRLNVGKIPLTNDELIRALFLRRRAATGSEAETLRLRIAYEWDQLEKALQSDSFWYFLSNEQGPKQNRIGFLFELVAQANGLPPGAKHDSYGIFYHYNQRLKEAGVDLKEEWLKIIGEVMLAEISEEDLRERVREKLERLEYGIHRSTISAMLLLFNIATLLENDRSNLRFQFDNFKRENWEIEHVRSGTGYQPQRHHERVAWLEHPLGYLQTQQTEQTEELQQEIKSFIALTQNEACDEDFESLWRASLFRSVLGMSS